MRLSLNEFENGIRKAAVGAGLPWGLADELAAACSRLAREGGDALAEALWALEEGGAMAWEAPAAMDRLFAGAEATRIAHRGHEALAGAWARAMAAAHGAGVMVAAGAAEITVTRGPAEAAPIADGVDVDPALWARIGALAAKTYVPSTEASRAKGAGAGLVDTD